MFEILFLTASLSAGSVACADHLAARNQIEQQYLQGHLDAAELQATAALDCESVDPSDRFHLELQLAKITDRRGLHQNTRPVTAAEAWLRRAEETAASLGNKEKAAIALAWAEYFYRAEIADRQFVEAEKYASKAASMFRDLGDAHGEADAVHRMGLIRFQQRAKGGEAALAEAHALFDHSLALDQEGGARDIFCGDYHRHVGFIDYVREDYAAALPHFQESLSCRRAAGAIDQVAFALQTLASAFVRAGDAKAAIPYLLEGQMIAEAIGSPVAKARLAMTAGDAYAALEQTDAACVAYRASEKSAAGVSLTSYVDAARENAEDVCRQ